MSYRTQLEKALIQHGWEVTKREDRGEWWEAEYWIIESRRNVWSLEVTLSSLVDPQFEGVKNHSAIWAVAANASPPIDRCDAESAISLLTIRDFRLPDMLKALIEQINTYRNQLHTDDS